MSFDGSELRLVRDRRIPRTALLAAAALLVLGSGHWDIVVRGEGGLARGLSGTGVAHADQRAAHVSGTNELITLLP